MTEPGGAARGQPERMAVGFARALRSAGLAVPPGNVLVFVEALGRVGLARRSGVYWAGQATLLRRPEDRSTYDRVFAAYWLGDPVVVAAAATRHEVVAVDAGPDGDGDTAPAAAEPPAAVVRYSPAEVLRSRDFARMSAAEWVQAQRVIAGLRLSAQRRRARRLRPARGPGGRADLRRTVRFALRADGEPVRLAWRAHSTRPRRLVLLVDVSGSMDTYARALLRFAHAAMCARGGLHVEVFTLGTRLTRLTRELSRQDPDLALAAATQTVPDWSGGTRLGHGLGEFNDRWGARGLARGAVTVVFSDGWDRGDPAELETEMARLHRLAHRVIWVNPLKASPGFAPLARGMAAALPWVDDFVSGHSISALEDLAALITGQVAVTGHRAGPASRVSGR